MHYRKLHGHWWAVNFECNSHRRRIVYVNIYEYRSAVNTHFCFIMYIFITGIGIEYHWIGVLVTIFTNIISRLMFTGVNTIPLRPPDIYRFGTSLWTNRARLHPPNYVSSTWDIVSNNLTNLKSLLLWFPDIWQYYKLVLICHYL